MPWEDLQILMKDGSGASEVIGLVRSKLSSDTLEYPLLNADDRLKAVTPARTQTASASITRSSTMPERPIATNCFRSILYDENPRDRNILTCGHISRSAIVLRLGA
jgi:hypothetical protein